MVDRGHAEGRLTAPLRAKIWYSSRAPTLLLNVGSRYRLLNYQLHPALGLFISHYSHCNLQQLFSTMRMYQVQDFARNTHGLLWLQICRGAVTGAASQLSLDMWRSPQPKTLYITTPLKALHRFTYSQLLFHS